tara:strand:- start:27 stop:812 length:786 start_codon:yes stop_codon:yes gene_type:complete
MKDKNVSEINAEHLETFLKAQLTNKQKEVMRMVEHLKRSKQLSEEEAIIQLALQIQGKEKADLVARVDVLNANCIKSAAKNPMIEFGAVIMQLIFNALDASKRAKKTGHGFAYEFQHMVHKSGLGMEWSNVNTLENLRSNVADENSKENKELRIITGDDRLFGAVTVINEIEKSIEHNNVNIITNIIAEQVLNQTLTSTEAYEIISKHAEMNGHDIQDYIAQVDTSFSREELQRENRLDRMSKGLSVTKREAIEDWMEYGY